MFAVVFYEEYVGSSFDDYSKVFKSFEKAQKYADKLNLEFAKANDCSVEDLGDYYIIEKIEIVEDEEEA